MSHPFVSVIIPLFNKDQYILETINSVLNQNFENFEVIVVDDGSSDSSLNIVQSMKDPRVFVYTQSNAGVEQARNFGFRHSSGSHVVFLDADDLMDPHRLSRQINLFKSNPSVVLIGTWATIIDKDGTAIGEISPPIDDEALKISLSFRNPFICSSVMVLRSAIDKVGLFNTSRGPRFAEDYEMWKRISSVGDLQNIPICLTSYRKLSSSRSNTNQESLLESARDIAANDLLKKTDLFDDISSAKKFVKAINGLDDLSIHSGSKIRSNLQIYDAILELLVKSGDLSTSARSSQVSRSHKYHIVVWGLLGMLPHAVQARIFKIGSKLKAFKPAQRRIRALLGDL